jgi:hypothetical protein
MGNKLQIMQQNEKLIFMLIILIIKPILGTTSQVMNCFFAIMGLILLSPDFSFFFFWIFGLVLPYFKQFFVVLFLLDLQILQKSNIIYIF